MKKRVRKNAHESRSFEERSWRRDDGYVQKKKKKMKAKEPTPKEASARGGRRCPRPSQGGITFTKPEEWGPG